MSDCCKLAGNFPITDRCIISISMSSSTDVSTVCDEPIIGPTTGTVSVTAYATNNIHVGCPGKASVSIPWIRKYDCDDNKVHFIFAGEGRSFIAGDVNGLASLKRELRSYKTVNASSSSGPSSIYMEDIQTDGQGLSYNGAPYSFTTSENGVEFGRIISVGPPIWYLQSFNLTCNPGQLPTAAYSFVFQMED
jgi:hypothetical protein